MNELEEIEELLAPSKTKVFAFRDGGLYVDRPTLLFPFILFVFTLLLSC